MAVRTGSGTLYDADDNELSAVTYRIEPAGDGEGPILAWSGGLELPRETPDVPIEAGRYRLELEDGTRGEIELEPAGATSGAGGEIAFTGVGVLGGGATATV